MSQNVINPYQTFRDSVGKPRAGGWLTFFVNKTTTKSEIFSDELLVTTQENPYRLDASGRVRGDVKYSGKMTLQEMNSDGSDIITTDDVITSKADDPPSESLITFDTVAEMQADVANAIIGVTVYLIKERANGLFDPVDATTVTENEFDIVTGNASISFQLRKEFRSNVLCMGAIVGVESTAAIQATIVYCEDNVTPLIIPTNGASQFYSTNATLSITKPIRIIGAGSRNVSIIASGLTVGQFAIDIDGTAFGTYEQAEISGFTIHAGSGDCMRIKNVSASAFKDIGLRNCRHGIVYTGTRCFSNSFAKIYGITTITGSTVLMDAHTGGGQHSFDYSTFIGATGFNISSDTVTDSISFYDGNFEQCTTNSFFCGGTVAGLSFDASRTEGCDGDDFQINPATGKIVSGLVIKGTSFSASDSGASDRIALGGAGGVVRGFEISGNTVGHGANNFTGNLVKLNGDGESGTIANNYLDGAIASCSPVNVLRAGVAVYNNEGNDGKFDPELTLTGWADYSGTSTIVGWSSLTVSKIYTRKIANTVYVIFQLDGTSNSTTATFTLPDTSSTLIENSNAWGIGTDNGTALTVPGRVRLPSNSATVTISKNMSGAAWTATGNKVIWGQFNYIVD